jgi:hypothetical protein
LFYTQIRSHVEVLPGYYSEPETRFPANHQAAAG